MSESNIVSANRLSVGDVIGGFRAPAKIVSIDYPTDYMMHIVTDRGDLYVSEYDQFEVYQFEPRPLMLNIQIAIARTPDGWTVGTSANDGTIDGIWTNQPAASNAEMMEMVAAFIKTEIEKLEKEG